MSGCHDAAGAAAAHATARLLRTDVCLVLGLLGAVAGRPAATAVAGDAADVCRQLRGWRGYALPILQDLLGWRAASLGLGLVWGVWNLPLFFIDGSSQAQIPPALFLLSVVAMSVVFAWLANHTAGSVVAALLFHTAINFWPAVVPVLPTADSYQAYALVVVVLCLLALLALRTHTD